MCLANNFKIVIEKQVEQLGTSELEFSYKTQSSTIICSTHSRALTEKIEHYVNKHPVYVLLIDASKVFIVLLILGYSLLYKHTVNSF